MGNIPMQQPCPVVKWFRGQHRGEMLLNLMQPNVQFRDNRRDLVVGGSQRDA